MPSIYIRLRIRATTLPTNRPTRTYDILSQNQQTAMCSCTHTLFSPSFFIVTIRSVHAWLSSEKDMNEGLLETHEFHMNHRNITFHRNQFNFTEKTHKQEKFSAFQTCPKFAYFPIWMTIQGHEIMKCKQPCLSNFPPMTDSGAASCTCTYIQDTTYESITVIFTAYSYYVREASTHNNPSITIITLITRTFTPVIHINKKTWSNKADQPTLQIKMQNLRLL